MINFLLDEKKTFAEGKNKLQAKKQNPIQVGGMRGGGGQKDTPPLRQTGVKFRVWTKCQSQIIELEPRPPLKKSGFSGQILIKLRL